MGEWQVGGCRGSTTRRKAFVDPAFAFAATFLPIPAARIGGRAHALVSAPTPVPAFAVDFARPTLFRYAYACGSRRRMTARRAYRCRPVHAPSLLAVLHVLRSRTRLAHVPGQRRAWCRPASAGVEEVAGA